MRLFDVFGLFLLILGIVVTLALGIAS